MRCRPEPCAKRHQSGLSLVEALISTLLLLITFVGMNQVLSRTLALQGQDYALGLTLFDIREQLQQPGSGIGAQCDGSASFNNLMLADGLIPGVSCTTINSVSFTLPDLGTMVVPLTQISVSTPESDPNNNLTGRLYGGDGVIQFSTTLQAGQ